MRLSSRLLRNSQEAFLLAVEVYNKPTIRYRVEAFCFLLANAWELLLKAKLIRDAHSSSVIFYRKVRGQQRRSLSLRDAVKRVFQNENDPVRRNIEEITTLRDAGTHLCVPELEPIYVGVFQASILNYSKKLKEWFRLEALEAGSPPMLSLVVDAATIDPVQIRKRHGKEVLDYLVETKRRLAQTASEIGVSGFSIPLEYRVVVTKKAEEADFDLSLSASAELTGTILEIPRDVESMYPYRQNEAVAILAERLQPLRFTSYDFQAILHLEKVKSCDSSPLHYHFKKVNTHMYSQALLDLVMNRVRRRSGYLDKARAKYKARAPA